MHESTRVIWSKVYGLAKNSNGSSTQPRVNEKRSKWISWPFPSQPFICQFPSSLMIIHESVSINLSGLYCHQNICFIWNDPICILLFYTINKEMLTFLVIVHDSPIRLICLWDIISDKSSLLIFKYPEEAHCWSYFKKVHFIKEMLYRDPLVDPNTTEIEKILFVNKPSVMSFSIMWTPYSSESPSSSRNYCIRWGSRIDFHHHMISRSG